MSTGALVIASKPFDPLRQIGSISVAQRMITTFQFAGAHPIVVLISQNTDKQLEKNLAHMGAIFCYVENNELLHCVRQGIAYLEDSCDRIVVASTNFPLFSVDTVTKLMQNDYTLAVPAYQGQQGYPMLIGREWFTHIMEHTQYRSLFDIAAKLSEHLHILAVDDSGIVTQAEETERCNKIVRAHSLNYWRPFFQLKIMREEVFWGPGVRQLLFLIGKTKSVRLACQQMGISYSKAWKLLNRFEQELDVQVVTRRKGGAHGGETDLTPEGLALMARFDAFEKDCHAAVNAIFKRHFYEESDTMSR